VTDQELAKFMGIENEPRRDAVIAALKPARRALFERMAQVAIEAELWAAGLGPKPRDALLDLVPRVDRERRRQRRVARGAA
jgi:hypothetical protein